MGNSIEEQIKRILEQAPTIEDYLTPIRDQIALLEKQLAEAKTKPKRQAIKRELNKHLRYVSQAGSRNRQRRPSARQIRRQRAEEKKLACLVRKGDKNRS